MWISKLIPEHVAFMQSFQTDPQAPARGRLRTPSHSPKVRSALRTESGRTADLIVFFVRFLQWHGGSHRGSGIGFGAGPYRNLLVREGRLFAARGSIGEHWASLGPAGTQVPGTKQLNASFNRLVVDGEPTSIRHSEWGSRKYREVRMDLIRRWVEENSYADLEEIDAALAVTTDGVSEAV